MLNDIGSQLETKLALDDSNVKVAEVTGLLKALTTQWVDYEGAAMAVQSSIPDDQMDTRLPIEIAQFGKMRTDFLLLETQASLYLESRASNKTPLRQPSP